MTGWQSGDRGQGGWGPDPNTSQYGTDPYANQYGSDPYRTGAHDPYAQADPYAQYPQQQPYHPTGGFPVQGYGPPPPPPKRSKLPMILSLVAIVIIVGAVVAIVLVNRKDTRQAGLPQGGTTTEQEPTDPTSEKTTGSGSPTSTEGGGTRDDWISIDNTADSGLRYQVPPDWKESSTTRQSGLGVDFTGNAEYGVYDCEGGNYVRTFAASGDVQGKGGKDLDLATTLEDFAESFATTYYGADAEVDVQKAKDADVDGKTAMTLTAKVTPKVTKPACQATTGEVALVGVQLETDGQPKGVAMLVVVNDLAGGPADPKPLAPSVTQEILSTVGAG